MYLGEVGLARLGEIFKAKLNGLAVWRKTSAAASVSFYPAPFSQLEPVVFFACSETLPSGDKSSGNPSTVSGKESVTILHGEDAHTQIFGFECYGGSFDFARGVLTMTHAAVEPEVSPVDISEHPADTSAPGIIDTWGRTVTVGSGGNSLNIDGDADGGLIVYKLAASEEIVLVSTGVQAPAPADKYSSPVQDAVSTSDGTVQVGYAVNLETLLS